MLYKFLFIILAASFVLMGCKDPEPATDIQSIRLFPVGEDSTDNGEPYYPFPDFIAEQIKYVEDNPFGIEKIVSVNGRMVDSGYIDIEAFKGLASAFLEINPNSDSIKPHFKETSFNDLSINRITFSIVARDTLQKLRKAEIWLNPENQKVKTILLNKQINQPDSMVVQHLLWAGKTHFQISETIQLRNGKAYDRVTRVVWDKPLED